MSAQHTPKRLPRAITKAIEELREAEWRSGTHRGDRTKIDTAQRWADTLKREIRAAIATTKQEPRSCRAGKDGDCIHKDCPQLRDGEPRATGRHCPLDTEEPHEH